MRNEAAKKQVCRVQLHVLKIYHQIMKLPKMSSKEIESRSEFESLWLYLEHKQYIWRKDMQWE